MESPRRADEVVLFGKPYRWAQDDNGTLSLWPALKPKPLQPPEVPFTSELIRDAMYRLRT